MHASSSPRASSQEAEPDTWLRHTGFMPKGSQQEDGHKWTEEDAQQGWGLSWRLVWPSFQRQLCNSNLVHVKMKEWARLFTLTWSLAVGQEEQVPPQIHWFPAFLWRRKQLWEACSQRSWRVGNGYTDPMKRSRQDITASTMVSFFPLTWKRKFCRKYC